MSDVIKYNNNFLKTDNIKSNLIYGAIIDDADISIVIPVYGLNKYFSELLENLKNQKATFLKVQIIVSDNKDYSTEENKVLNLIKEYHFENLAYFLSKKTLGQLNNFNRAVLLASTDYVSMIHDDDLLVENYYKILENTLNILKKKKKISMIHTQYEMFYDRTVNIRQANKVRIYEIKKLSVSLYAATQTGIPSCGTIFNREDFINAGGFNDEYPSSGDAFLAATMIQQGKKIYKFKDIVGYYRVGANLSLKLNLCQGFIKEDDMFLDSWYNRANIMKIWLKIAKRYIYSKNIDSKVLAFGKMNPEITIQSLDYKKEYKKYRNINIFKFIKLPIVLWNKLLVCISTKTIYKNK